MTRLLREVTREEWRNLPSDRCYAKLDERPERTSAYRYFEIVDPGAGDDRVPVKGLAFSWIDPCGERPPVRMVVTSVQRDRVYATSLNRWNAGKGTATVAFYGADKWRAQTAA